MHSIIIPCSKLCWSLPQLMDSGPVVPTKRSSQNFGHFPKECLATCTGATFLASALPGSAAPPKQWSYVSQTGVPHILPPAG